MIALVLLFSAPLEAAVLNIVAIGASNTSGRGVGPQECLSRTIAGIIAQEGHSGQRHQRRGPRRHNRRHASARRQRGALGCQHRHPATGGQRSPLWFLERAARSQHRGDGEAVARPQHPRHRI